MLLCDSYVALTSMHAANNAMLMGLMSGSAWFHAMHTMNATTWNAFIAFVNYIDSSIFTSLPFKPQDIVFLPVNL